MLDCDTVPRIVSNIFGATIQRKYEQFLGI